ncbi:MAG: glycosyltransferase [Cyanobacteria bacterium J06627_32]
MLLSKLPDMKVIAWPAFKTRYANPYTWLLYSHMPEGVSVVEFSSKRLLLGRFDIFHLHWPVETLVRHPNLWVARLRVLIFWLLLKISRWRGTKVIWTIHDEKPHVVLHQRLADWFTQELIANTDGCIHLCGAGRKAVNQSMPGLAKMPSFVVPHGHYRGCYPDTLNREDARSQLALSPDATVLLYLGYISPYKNVPHLINTFQALPPSDQPVTLLIAGKADSDEMKQAVLAAAEDADGIQLHLRFIRDDELQIFFKAADLVVLPFEEILNSGSLLLALSFDRPVLASHLGAVADWQAQIGANWVNTYSGKLTPEVLAAAVQDRRSHAEKNRKKACQKADEKAPLDSLEWNAIAQQTLGAYQSTRKQPLNAPNTAQARP